MNISPVVPVIAPILASSTGTLPDRGLEEQAVNSVEHTKRHITMTDTVLDFLLIIFPVFPF
jgi:hypothetical protein